MNSYESDLSKSFRFCSYKKRVGGIGLLLTSPDGLMAQTSVCVSAEGTTPVNAKSLATPPAAGCVPYPYDRHRSVTGPSIGCTISPPVRRASIKFAFNAKYHFAGRSASSISISRGLCFNPSACRIIVS